MAAIVGEREETFFDGWTLDEAAERAGLSRRRFSALFRENTGGSFGDHLAGLRLAHAARLLQSGDETIIGVMFACGFNDLSHFYRLFRARYGTPPQAWRSQWRR